MDKMSAVENDYIIQVKFLSGVICYFKSGKNLCNNKNEAMPGTFDFCERISKGLVGEWPFTEIKPIKKHG